MKNDEALMEKKHRDFCYNFMIIWDSQYAKRMYGL